jgi:UTP--glucose-1-phosphate uridylyltransferase
MTDFKVKKAVFLVAGFGTRFLPISKAVPKHMLPIVDKPILQLLVEEAVEARIEEIIFVTGRGKNAIEEHFDTSYELEQTLIGKGKTQLLQQVENIAKLAKFAYVRQPMPKGDGDAIKHARPFINNEPILVVYPDYIMPKENNTFKRMVEFYEQTGKSIIATDIAPMEKISSFGVIDAVKTDQENILKVTKFVEKPKREEAPSDMINLGHAILTPQIWQLLEDAQSTASDGEIRVADAFVSLLAKGEDLYALRAIRSGFDCGNALGFLKANIDAALQREDIKDELWDFLKETMKRKEMREELVELLSESMKVLK